MILVSVPPECRPGAIEFLVYDPCDGICHEKDCRDESLCNNLTYGEYCETGYYLPILFLVIPGLLREALNERCHVYDPFPADRYSFLDQYTGPVCQHSVENKTAPLFNFTRCATVQYDPSVVADTDVWWVTSPMTPYCINMMDQTNCTDFSRVA